jgi:hypothetical protein
MAGLFFSLYNLHMTNAELATIYSEFLNFYNNKVPSMEHEPVRFNYYIKLFLYSRRK